MNGHGNVHVITTRAGDMLILSQNAGKSVELCNFQIVLFKVWVPHLMNAYLFCTPVQRRIESVWIIYVDSYYLRIDTTIIAVHYIYILTIDLISILCIKVMIFIYTDIEIYGNHSGFALAAAPLLNYT